MDFSGCRAHLRFASVFFLSVTCFWTFSVSEEDLFLEMLDNLAGEGEKDALNIFTARLATMACKSAVKGNNKLSFQEADQLIDQLLTLNNPYHCPHGRPTIISMTKTEIEKKFKRII